jgi:glutamate-5-semialdehyde dehydrogenase
MLSVQSLAELDQAIARSRLAAQALGQLTGWEKTLHHMADALDEAQDNILEANTLDLEACLDMAMPERVIDWLKLNPERLCTATTSLRRLAHLGAVQHLGAFSPNSFGCQWEALGVVALVYEALPELAIFAVGLCLLTGNSLILKGGNEASQTNQAIAEALQGVIEASPLPEAIIQVISTSEGEPTRRWLMQSNAIDLMIPYGRPSLVQQVQREALSPVLPTAIGNCYLYWAPSGDEHIAAHAIIDSHRGHLIPSMGLKRSWLMPRLPHLTCWSCCGFSGKLTWSAIRMAVLMPRVIWKPWMNPNGPQGKFPKPFIFARCQI